MRVKRLSEHAVLPSRATPMSVGYDLSALVPARGKALIYTDLIIAIPEGHYGRIAPRSSLAWQHHIDVGAGVIDPDYRGAVGVVLFNHSADDFRVERGDRVAQLILERASTPEVEEVTHIDYTKRDTGGFGSTGKN
jgi:dUTP pyrophosphatase